jgi:hypothetical protein
MTTAMTLTTRNGGSGRFYPPWRIMKLQVMPFGKKLTILDWAGTRARDHFTCLGPRFIKKSSVMVCGLTFRTRTFCQTMSDVTNISLAGVGGLKDSIEAYERNRMFISGVITHMFGILASWLEFTNAWAKSRNLIRKWLSKFSKYLIRS